MVRNRILISDCNIKNPFNKLESQTFTETKLRESADFLIYILDENLELESIDGLGTRFYESFAGYFSGDRKKKEEMTNSFSNLIKNFEPYVKKIVYSKTKDEKKARISLNQTLLQHIITFESDLNKADENYWKDKRLIESCIRLVFPFRHIEAHEARNWEIFEMEKAVFYMFASIVLINLEARDS